MFTARNDLREEKSKIYNFMIFSCYNYLKIKKNPIRINHNIFKNLCFIRGIFIQEIYLLFSTYKLKYSLYRFDIYM